MPAPALRLAAVWLVGCRCSWLGESRAVAAVVAGGRAAVAPPRLLPRASGSGDCSVARAAWATGMLPIMLRLCVPIDVLSRESTSSPSIGIGDALRQHGASHWHRHAWPERHGLPPRYHAFGRHIEHRPSACSSLAQRMHAPAGHSQRRAAPPHTAAMHASSLGVSPQWLSGGDGGADGGGWCVGADGAAPAADGPAAAPAGMHSACAS